MVLTDNQAMAERVKHLTTTAKIRHQWAFEHDEVGFNYRLPNLNAALGLAQMESLTQILQGKRVIAIRYQGWGEANELKFVKEASRTKANYWLNTVITDGVKQRDEMLEYTNRNGVMTRPAWTPMHQLPMYTQCQKMALPNTEWLHQRVVNVPSSLPSSECT